MKLQIVSDLHLEFAANRKWLESNPLLPCGDILLIAGDSYCLSQPEPALEALHKLCDAYPTVVLTFGNHEFYGSEIGSAYPRCREQLMDRHIRLNNDTFTHDELRLICSTLWSNVPAGARSVVESRLNDYHHIRISGPDGGSRKISVDDSNALHQASLEFIENELEKPWAGKTVVLTHHLPSLQCVPEEFRGSELTTGFATDLDNLIESNPQISLWIHGHAHDFQQIRIGATLVARNPLGYVDYGDHKDFRRDFCLEI